MPFRVVVLLTLMALSASCSHRPQEINRAEKLAEAGNYEAALLALGEQYQKNPENSMYKGALIRTTNSSVAALSGLADSALNNGRIEEAKELFMRALAIDAQNRRAQSGLRLVEQVRRQQNWLQLATTALNERDDRTAMSYVRKVLMENPDDKRAKSIRLQLRARRQETRQQTNLGLGLDQGISLELRDAGLRDALLLISQSAKLNFILDQDIPTDTPVTLFVNDASIEDVIEFMLQTYALEKKLLNSKTLLIYPATPEKKARYADLYTRTFHVSHSDPGTVAEVLRSMLKPSDLHIDETSRSLIIRDTAEVLEAAERLIELHDVAPPEVLLDVEILEISTDVLSNLGIDYPSRLSLSVTGQDGKAGALRFSELTDLNGDSFTLGVGDPLAVLNLKNTLGNGNILAKPQIRVKNREQANILIGDRVPVITSTLNQTSGFESQSVTYLDVGIKLDVQPEIFPGNEVSIKVLLEVSNIAKEIVGDSGLLAYQIGTRTASTTLQLRDGETQILAGLIKNEEINSESRVPGLAAIPGLGRFFVNENNTHKKSELVLLITPRIVRNIQLPDAYTSEFYSGTKDRFSLRFPEIGPHARYSREAPLGHTEQKDLQNSVTADAPNEVGRPVASRTAIEAVAQLNMTAPRAINSGQVFSITIALDAAIKAKTKFSLSYETEALDIVSVAPVTQDAWLTHEESHGRVKFTLDSIAATRQSDILATVSFKARPTTSESTSTLSLQPTNGDELTTPILSGLSHQLQIMPATANEFLSTDNPFAPGATNP